ncbi:MAG: hypothetical protein JXA38_02700 [Methanosarcinaceae archaeon]|nr:hypothetical protein [Methanosarcinaceae archaeon]
MVVTGAIMTYMFYLSSPEKQSSTTKRLQYMVKAHKGKTIIPKYTTDVAFLKEVVPLEKVYPKGIVQFTWNRYGVLFRLYVPSETEGGLESFIPLVVSNFVNRIVEPQTLKVFAMNKYIQAPNVVNEVLGAMNDSSKTPEQVAHLDSVYRQLIETVAVPTQKHIYMLIGLGVFDSVEKAELALRNLLPSLNDGFALTRVTGIRVIDPNEIALAYRRCLK